MTQIESLHDSGTPIQKFYAGANVLVTGGTGFLGRILLEKLLRSCPDLNTIYVLVREKKGKDLHTRVDELFEDTIFDRLRQECPKFRHKVVGVAADCSLKDLAISQRDRQLLINEVTIVFHVAATVRFDEPLKMAVAINVRGPGDVINLARQMPNLKAMIHVSTAYSNVPNSVIEERIYPSPIECQKLVSVAEALPEDILDNITPTLLGEWPNTYTYTKAVAEDMVKQEGHNMPIAVFRPAIVVSTYREPIKAWINNFYGPTGVSAGAGTGVLRTLYCNKAVNANIVPVDMCVNSMIATAWEVSKNYEISKNEKVEYEIPVYTYESSNDQPINWGTFMAKSEKSGINVPSMKAIWYYCLTLQSNYFCYLVTVFFLHFLPAILVDGALLCVGKSPKMCKIYKKIHKFTAVISYFCTRDWTFRCSRVQNLIKTMTEEDRELFFCDLRKLDWDEFFLMYLRGIRSHLVQDPLESLEDAQIRWNRLYWCHQAVKAIAGYLLLRLVWALISTLWSLVS